MQPDVPFVHVIEDDESVAPLLTSLLTRAGNAVELYGSGQDFLERYEARTPQCLLLDLCLPRMSGLEVLRRLVVRSDHPPVLMMSGYGRTESAVEAMKLGAEDFLEKPIEPAQLIDAVARAIERDRRRAAAQRVRGQALEQLALLTPREREVFDLLVRGHSSKVVAANLQISKKTVDLHRGNVMHKLGARSVIDLLRLALAAEDPRNSSTRPP